MAEVVGLVSGIASLVTMAMQITKLSYSYIADIRSAHSTQKQYLREVSALTEVLLRSEEVSQNLEKENIGLSRPSDLSKSVVAECAQKLDKLCVELRKPSPSIFWPIQEKNLKKHIEDLHRFRSIFADFLSAQALTVATATHQEVTRLVNHQDQTDLLEWLGNPKESSRLIPNPLSNTGARFLSSEAYKQWTAGSKPPLLWCHGPPGVGKSMLAAVAIQDLGARAGSVPVLYYFFDFGSRKEQTKETIWKALLRQVIRKGSASTVQKLVNFRNELGLHRPAGSKDFSDALKIACADQQFSLVLDGPDEMENSRELKSILVPFTNASVLVTSRDTPEIRSTLSQATKMEVQADSNDMRAYVASRFEECDLDDVIERHPELENEILEKSQGIFLFVRLLVDQLVELSTVKEMRKALQVYPTHLDEAFESSLQRINAQSKSRSNLAHRVMGWIVSAERKLQMSELAHGLATEEGIDVTDEENLVSSKTILKVCGGLVALQGTAVGMVHTTVHTWLRNRYDGLYQKDLAESCLRYLTMSSFLSGVVQTLDEMDQRLSTFPFFSYAAQNWRRHFGSTEDVADSKSIDRLLDDSGLRSAAFQGANYNNNLKSPVVRGATFETIPHGGSALHFASYWNLPAKAEKLLLHGEEKNATNAQKWTPLHWACFAQSHEAVEVLLSYGVNTNARDSGGWTPLFWAALKGDTTTVQALLRHGASHTERDNHDWTAVRWAVASLQTDVVKMLLEHHTKIASSSYNTPSLRNLAFDDARACITSYSRTIERDLIDELEGTLTKSDAYINEYDDLLTMFQKKTFDIKRLWRSRRFDPPVWNAWRSMCTDSGMLGPDYYIDSYTQELSWKSRTLQSAIRDGKLLAIRLLIEAGAEVNHAAEQTPLHAATFKKDICFAEILIKHGAHIEARNHYNLTPLQQAVSNGFEEVTRLLLSNGANANVSCNEPPARCYDRFLEAHWTASKTPLMLACGMSEFDMDGSAQMVKMLLEHGADPNIEHKMDEGKTAFNYAAEARSPKILKLLFDASSNSGGLDQAQKRRIYDGLLRRDGERPKFDSKRNLIPVQRKECLEILLQAFGRDFFNQKSDCWSRDGMYTPLSLAAVHKDWEIFQGLHALGASFETNAPLEECLDVALCGRQFSAVKTLIANGAGIPSRDEQPESTATRYKWIQHFRLFFQNSGITSDEVDQIRDIMEILVSRGFDIDATGPDGCTLLQYAVQIESPELVECLLNIGANPYHTNEAGIDSFLLACLGQKVMNLRCLLGQPQKPTFPDHWVQHFDIAGAPEDGDFLAEASRALKSSGEINKQYGKRTLVFEAASMDNWAFGGVADSLQLEDIAKFGDFPQLWDKLRVGTTMVDIKEVTDEEWIAQTKGESPRKIRSSTKKPSLMKRLSLTKRRLLGKRR